MLLASPVLPTMRLVELPHTLQQQYENLKTHLLRTERMTESEQIKHRYIHFQFSASKRFSNIVDNAKLRSSPSCAFQGSKQSLPWLCRSRPSECSCHKLLIVGISTLSASNRRHRSAYLPS
jgi:hypothetical protein